MEETSKVITARDFISEYLIDQIGKIKDTYPYFAFLLMAVGIEFLGKCLNEPKDDWKGTKSPEVYFNDGLRLLDIYEDIKDLDLYHILRCGMVHSLLTDNSLKLSDKSGGEPSISCKDFYESFRKACQKVLEGRTDGIEIIKDLDAGFLNVDTTIDEDGSSVSTTGATSTHVVAKPKRRLRK